MQNKVEVGDGVACLKTGDVIVALWQRPATVERVRWMGGHTQPFAESAPNGIILLQVILPSSTPPSGRARVESNEWAQRLIPRVRQIVMVAVGDTLWVTMVRAVMRTAVMLTGQGKRLSVLGTEREGFAKVREFASADTPPLSELHHAVDELYQALGAARVGSANSRSDASDPKRAR